ncbi:hypothetical protein D3C77_518430 [compost metagenome]
MADRLDQERTDADRLRGGAHVVVPECTDHDGLRRGLQCKRSPCRLDAIHSRHLPIDEHHPERMVRRGIAQGVESSLTGGYRDGREPRYAKHVGKDLAGSRVVIDDQHARASEFRGDDPALPLRALANTQPGAERERTAVARLGVYGDRPAHQLDEALADGKAQAGPAVLTRG